MKQLIALLLAAGVSPAYAATAVLFESDAGDYIGQGQRQVFQSPGWTIAHNASTSLVTVSINGPTWWNLEFEMPRGSSFAQTGNYGGATRYPFNSPTRPGLSVSGDGRGCNTLTGWFEVREALFGVDGALIRMAIDFRQNCEGGTSALFGAVRINSDVPLDLSGPHAIAGFDQVAFGRDALVLDGRQSFDRNSELRVYTWQQLDGPPVQLRGANSPMADFTAPYAPPGGDDYLFQLTVRNALGQTDVDTVAVRVETKTDPHTYIFFQSDPGDWVGAGRTFRLMPGDGDFSALRNYRGGISMNYSGSTWYHLDFGPPQNTPFAPGPYENAQRFAFADANRPGIDIGGDGRGCNTITGRFDVLQAVVTNNTVARFGVNFEQHCEGGAAALRGEARFNYLAAGAPTAHAGADQTVSAGADVMLDGTGSSDDGGIAVYQWRQLAGPAITITGADGATPTFKAPAVTTATALTLELVVVDAGELTGGDTVVVNVLPADSGGGSDPGSGTGSGPSPGAGSGSGPAANEAPGYGDNSAGATGVIELLLLHLAVLARRRRRFR